jgi:hypothetical protein
MLRSPHRRRSSAFSSLGDTTTRRRGESITSTAGEGMELVQDEEDDYDEIEGQVTKDGESGEPRRTPLRLRGRGGFSHARGRGRGRGIPATHNMSKSPTTSSGSPPDPVDSLASSMSALQFVPHSVRMARGRGRARGAA